MDRSPTDNPSAMERLVCTCPAPRVREFVALALETTGATHDCATAVADVLTDTSLRGVDSHGIRLLNHYVRVLRHGRINPSASPTFKQTGHATGVVDADDGFGHPASNFAIDEAMRLAANAGVAAVSVTHSSHFGAAGSYVLRATSKGFVALGMCNSDSFVLPHDGLKSFHGTNPLAFAAPVRNDHPFLLDMATSVIPWNRVQDLKDGGLELPPEVSVDALGQLTRDPEKSAALLPLGGIGFGYKGAGLAAMIEILSAVVTGMPHCSRIQPMAGPEIATPRQLGHFFIVIDPTRFVSASIYDAAVGAYLSDLRSQPAHADKSVLAPGDREWKIEKQRLEHGIPINEALRQQFHQLAESLHIPQLQLSLS